MRYRLFGLLAAVFVVSAARAGEADRRLDFYFIDVEGGSSTLVVTPAGESILIDTGFPGNQGRDLNRILHVVKDVAKLDHIDHAVVTHWHLDHYGNHASLAGQIKIKNFWDRGIPDSLQEDGEFPQRIALYRAAAQNASQKLRAGDKFELDGHGTPLSVEVLTASREVVPNEGKPNPFAAANKPQADDPSDNSASVSLLIAFGDFQYLGCGDLTWNTEAKLMTPNNPVGIVDLFLSTHHGLNQSNNPTLVLAIDPTVIVMNNGATKGGDIESIKTFKAVKSLKALYQSHRAVKVKDEDQAPKEFIANLEAGDQCAGRWIKASVAPDGKSFTVQIDEDGKPATYETRAK